MTFRCVTTGALVIATFIVFANGGAVNARTTLADASPQGWEHIGVGSQVYMGADGGGFNDSAQVVCPSPADYFKWSRTWRIDACRAVRHGTPAIIETLIPNTPGKRRVPFTVVLVRAVNNSWRGYTALLLLQPNIVAGSILTMRDDIAGASAKLAVTSDSRGGVQIGQNIKVRVLKYDPRRRSRTLYVRVLEGKYRGREGWMDIANAKTNVLGRYGCCSY